MHRRPGLHTGRLLLSYVLMNPVSLLIPLAVSCAHVIFVQVLNSVAVMVWAIESFQHLECQKYYAQGGSKYYLLQTSLDPCNGISSLARAVSNKGI